MFALGLALFIIDNTSGVYRPRPPRVIVGVVSQYVYDHIYCVGRDWKLCGCYTYLTKAVSNPSTLLSML